jgi:hypothetical protein
MNRARTLGPEPRTSMAFLNTYKPPVVDVPRDIHSTTPPEEYDHNFMFEVRTLRSDRVEMRPFVVSYSSCIGLLICSWAALTPCQTPLQRHIRMPRGTPLVGHDRLDISGGGVCVVRDDLPTQSCTS